MPLPFLQEEEEQCVPAEPQFGQGGLKGSAQVCPVHGRPNVEQGGAVLCPSPAVGRGHILLCLLCMAQAHGEQEGLMADLLCHPSELRFGFLSDLGTRD